ncbi:MAG TPA: winged helix-turn-helix domain-containing protein, partial [Pyrinomonadaceae bacterium]|nr:winged helix-turn-helix domain-containing protein [Pyrinomonadaceae bacterium]
LTPKALQILIVLLQNHGSVVEKEYFLNEVWPDTFVEESTLAQNILTLRKTLRRFEQERDFIVTIPRRGHEFVGDVQNIYPDREAIANGREKDRNGGPPLSELAVIHGISPVSADAPRQAPHQSWFVYPGSAVIVGILAVLVVTVGYLAFFRTASVSFAESQFRTFRVDEVVADADIRNSIVSPNGKYLALVQVKNGVQSLYVRQTENGNTSELVPQINGKFIGAAFSPMSDEIYYSVDETSPSSIDPVTTLYTVSVLGGAAKEILHNISSPPAISPSGTHIAFTRRHPGTRDAALVITDIDGKNERDVVTPGSDSEFTHRAVSWSPDGKLLSATMLRRLGRGTEARVVIVDAESGDQKTISDENWTSAGDTIWLADGSGILAVAFGATSPSLNDELWLVSYPSGKARLITKGINGNYGISLNRATNAVVAVQSNKFACFLTASVNDLYKNTHVLTTVSDRGPLPFGADWTNDGRIVYSSAEGGNADIFAISEDGEQKQLTSDPAAEISPRLSADGRLLIFMSNRSGQMDVWRSDANGTNASQLTTNGNVTDSVISPDASSVFYLVQDPDTKVEKLWRVSIDGENAVQITDRTTRSPRISPDGNTIAAYISGPETNTMMLGLLSTRTGEILKYLETPPHDDIPFLDWSKDGQDLFVVLRRGKPESLWKVPLNGPQPSKLREWENDAIFRLAISRSGERIFYEVGNELNSVVQIQSLDAET